MNKLTTIIICLGLSLMLGIFFVYPKYGDYGLLKEQIKLKNNELNFRKEYLEQLYQTAKNLEEYQEKLTIIDSALPDRASLPNLFYFLQIAASQNGLIVRSISPSQESYLEDDNDLKFTDISISLSGLYNSLQGFIEKIEKSSRLIEIQNIDFKQPEEGKIFDFNLNIKVFHY